MPDRHVSVTLTFRTDAPPSAVAMSVGLVPVEQPWGTCWQAPGTDLRFTRGTDEATAA